MKMHRSLSALAVAAVLALPACAAPAAEDHSGGGMSHDGSYASADATHQHNDADVMFAQMMIPHHRQAVEMSGIILAKDGVDPEVAELAAAIRDAQGPEMDIMTGWLQEWGEPMEPHGGMAGHDMGSGSGMAGMLSDTEMAELAAAEGPDASRLFLESMTAHHDGALDMAQDEIDNGVHPGSLELARTIIGTQQAEMDRMAGILARL